MLHLHLATAKPRQLGTDGVRKNRQCDREAAESPPKLRLLGLGLERRHGVGPVVPDWQPLDLE